MSGFRGLYHIINYLAYFCTGNNDPVACVSGICVRALRLLLTLPSLSRTSCVVGADSEMHIRASVSAVARGGAGQAAVLSPCSQCSVLWKKARALEDEGWHRLTDISARS